MHPSSCVGEHDRAGWSVAYGMVLATFAAMLVVADPRGEVPVDDDWAYAWSVAALVDRGELRISDWSAANLLPQILWGALFSAPFGFSFTAVRASTLVAAATVLVAMLAALRELGCDRTLAIRASLAIAVNPLFFAMACSFNTDVPSLALVMLASYFFLRGCVRASTVFVGLGVAVALVAVLERQSNAVIPLAFAVAYVVEEGRRPRVIAAALGIALAGVATEVLYGVWLRHAQRMPYLYGLQVEGLLETWSGGLAGATAIYARNAATLLPYVGLFAFPVFLTAYLRRVSATSPRARSLAATCVLAMVAGGAFVLRRAPLPSLGNVLEPTAIGPHEFATVLAPTERALASGTWWLWTLVALGGVAMLLVSAHAEGVRCFFGAADVRRGARAAFTFGAVAILLYLGGVAGLPRALSFDRYVLPLFAIAVLMVAASGDGRASAERFASVTSGTLLVAFATFSVVVTHDWFAATRARWSMVHDWMDTHAVGAEAVGGGWDFRGWHFGNRIETCNPDLSSAPAHTPAWADFTCLNDRSAERWVVSDAVRPGHRVEAEVPFRRWLPPRTERIYLLAKP
jgi:hypothetical protein